MPVVVAGLVANDRRIAWVQLGLVAIAFLLMNPASALTRRVARGLVLMSPLLLAYTVVGWSSPSRVFAPVGFVRSIVQPERTDGSLDRSTLFRDVENFNLVNTFRSNPVVGTGFGHPFVVTVEGDALPDFVEYGFLPHNSMLGLWAFTGFVGFSGIFGTLVVASLLAVRARARAPTLPSMPSRRWRWSGAWGRMSCTSGPTSGSPKRRRSSWSGWPWRWPGSWRWPRVIGRSDGWSPRQSDGDFRCRRGSAVT